MKTLVLWVPIILLAPCTVGLAYGHTSAPIAADEAELGRCIREAAAGHGWLEMTLWGLRDVEGGWAGAAILNKNGSRDLGPLQINSQWVPKLARLLQRPRAHIHYWLRFDPCFNAGAARWIFLSGLADAGDYWKAVGTYHSPTARRQQQYAARVSVKLLRRFGSSAFRSVADDTPVRQLPNANR